MQIGYGKQGVRIGQYGGDDRKPGKDGNAVLGYIEPACDRPQWILWFTKQGDALLYIERDASGGVRGEPVRVNARSEVRRLEQ